MTTEKRTPAFWRVRDGQYYWSVNGCWDSRICNSKMFYRLLDTQEVTRVQRGKPVPVYLRVIHKPNGHNVWWAAKQLDHNKRVRRAAWRPERHLVPSPDNTRLDILRWLLSQDAADIDATDWELAE